jgi:membrane protein DedA with SNARE-associated domain
MRHLSLAQALVAVASLISITTLCALDKVDPTVVVVVISTVLGTAIGYANGKMAGDK